MLALVTGGARGIGFAIAKKLAENGYDVVITGRDRKRLDDARRKLEKTGARAYSFECDVTDRRHVEGVVEKVWKIGPLDVLVNNAGVAFNRELLGNSDDEIERMIDTNLKGVIDCTRTFLPRMVERRKGIIINISSGAGKYGFPGLAVYSATKFAVIGFTEALAREVERRGVRVFAICPGDTDTDMWRSLYPGQKATYVPEDVAIEVMELVKNADRVKPGSAIDVRKHVR
jgi:NAD(P)-dependent dehydrogenase (short-subunit alcohol dehydrogenase family)